MTIAGLTCAIAIALSPAAPGMREAEPSAPRPVVPASPVPSSAASAESAAAPAPEAPPGSGFDADAGAARTSLPPPEPLPGPSPLRGWTDPATVRQRSLRLSGAVLLAVPIFGELLWWRNEETERFHSVRENWLGRDTYAGGADKVSHVFGGFVFSRELALGFERLGNSPARSRALSTAMTALTGILVEGGDGFSTYGFSWEDVFSDMVGAGFAAGVGAAGLEDVAGVRLGYVKTSIPPKCCRATAYGSDYSREIYSFDLKLDGAFRRMGVSRPGPARFLLLSLTYGSKGYRFSPVDKRERNVGVDVGLNMVEVLKAVGVSESSWWGLPILKFFTYYRLEYTAWGWRYDFNHGKWSGFGTGGRFDPGRVVYQ